MDIFNYSQRKGFNIHTREDLDIYEKNELSVEEVMLDKFRKHVKNFISTNKDCIPTPSNTSLVDLEQRLLSFGGNSFCVPRGDYEEDLKQIMDRGTLWLPIGLKKMIGRPSQCHKNVAELWHNNKDNTCNFSIATGYALDETGWIQHTWGILKKPRGTSIVETTTPKRLAYYGYVLTEAEASDFFSDNM